MLKVFLQNPDTLSGGAGWVGAGLLGLVLGWLMLRHLPEKDKLILDMLKQFRDELATERTKSEAAVAVVVATFTKESEECRAERLSLGAAMTAEREKDRQSRLMLWQQVKEVITARSGMAVAVDHTPPDGTPVEAKK